MSYLRSLIERAYTTTRGFEIPDSVPTSVLAGFAGQKAIDAARGAFAAKTYGSSGARHFRGPGCRVRAPSYLHIGDFVAFGTGVVVEGFGRDGIRLGNQVTVASGARLLASGVIREPGVGISVGNRAAVGMDNLLWGQGGISIGPDTLLGPNVTVLSENHGMVPGIPILDQPTLRAPVEIGADCWIGINAVVLAGVTIGDGAVVAAGAVVSRSVAAGDIVGGVPARVIGTRSA